MDRPTPNPVTRTRVSAEVIGAMAAILLEVRDSGRWIKIRVR